MLEKRRDPDGVRDPGEWRGEIDATTYAKLSAIAPTITRPEDTAAAVWTWPNQLLWIGNIHDGRQGKARDLINSARSQQDDLRNQHPAFAGKTIEAVYLSGSGAAAALSESNITDYLQGLGFSYSQDLQRVPGDARPLRPIKSDNLCLINTDALVVICADKPVGSGGFDGLRASLTGYRGAMVIVDDPDVIAALADPGGYLGHRIPQLRFRRRPRPADQLTHGAGEGGLYQRTGLWTSCRG